MLFCLCCIKINKKNMALDEINESGTANSFTNCKFARISNISHIPQMFLLQAKEFQIICLCLFNDRIMDKPSKANTRWASM